MRTLDRTGLPRTEVYFYRDADGFLPLLKWLDELPGKVQLKCTARISRLAEMGNQLHRPEADYLRDGIFELRARYQGIHYRILLLFREGRRRTFPWHHERTRGSGQGDRPCDPTKRASQIRFRAVHVSTVTAKRSPKPARLSFFTTATLAVIPGRRRSTKKNFSTPRSRE